MVLSDSQTIQKEVDSILCSLHLLMNDLRDFADFSDFYCTPIALRVATLFVLFCRRLLVLYRCIFACAYLGNGTGRRTVTMVEPLLLTSGPEKYEAGLHSNFFFILLLCVCKWMYARDGLD